MIPGGRSAGKQKPLRKAAYDLAVLNVADRIFRFIDVGGIHAHQGGLDRPSTPALQAPVGASEIVLDFDHDDKAHIPHRE